MFNVESRPPCPFLGGSNPADALGKLPGHLPADEEAAWTRLLVCRSRVGNWRFYRRQPAFGPSRSVFTYLGAWITITVPPSTKLPPPRPQNHAFNVKANILWRRLTWSCGLSKPSGRKKMFRLFNIFPRPISAKQRTPMQLRQYVSHRSRHGWYVQKYVDSSFSTMPHEGTTTS